MAFYQMRKGKLGLKASMVQQQLRLSAFKIADIPSALNEASDTLEFLERRAQPEQDVFLLTKHGLRLVNRLPAALE